MDNVRRITANIPENLLLEAEQVTGKGITGTIIEGLKMLKRSKAFEKAQALKNVELSVDTDLSRERHTS